MTNRFSKVFWEYSPSVFVGTLLYNQYHVFSLELIIIAVAWSAFIVYRDHKLNEYATEKERV